MIFDDDQNLYFYRYPLVYIYIYIYQTSADFMLLSRGGIVVEEDRR